MMQASKQSLRAQQRGMWLNYSTAQLRSTVASLGIYKPKKMLGDSLHTGCRGDLLVIGGGGLEEEQVLSVTIPLTVMVFLKS